MNYNGLHGFCLLFCALFGLGRPAPAEIGPCQRSSNRLLWFLNEEGFFDCLDALASEDDGLVYPRKEDREKYRLLQVTPSYEDARCIPVNLFSVPLDKPDNRSFARNTVENLLRGIDSKLDSKVAPQARDRLTYKLCAVLQEVLHNAQEHAYEESATVRLLAIYVRYRMGGIGLDSNGKVFDKLAQTERSQCPGLDSEWLTTRQGCLEVFVLDRGIGMVRNFERGGISLNKKHKFRQVMEETFLDGKSSKTERQTAYGGLHLLHNLLSDTGDFIRGLEGGTWFASAAPIVRTERQRHIFTANKASMNGLAMHFRLGWKTETDDGDKWASFNPDQDSEVWSELALHEGECVSSFQWFQKQSVIDERFGDEHSVSQRSDWVLWLVRPHRMKGDILTFLERKVAPTVISKVTLIIADIPSYEAATYAAALAEFRTYQSVEWPKKFSRIILCTNRWRFASVDYETKEPGYHGFSRLREDLAELRITPPRIKPTPKSFRLVIMRWLKWHDSNLFWEEIEKRGSMFIPETVRWGSDDHGDARLISGYLDFPKAARNPQCANIYRASLARVLGILPPNQVHMCSLDLLTMTVLRDIHTTEVYEPAVTQPPDQLAVGSVLVSGATLDASVAQGLDLHFFVHQSSPLRGKKCSLLFWLPTSEIRKGVPRLARIGKTATIAQDGWKSFEVPRFDAAKKLIGARDPRKTYEDWQSSYPVIVKTGHWSYQGHHDFVTINIAGAVEAAFLEKNDLARFLVQRVLPFIGLSGEHLKENCRRLLEDTLVKFGKPLQSMGYGLLVYRSHPSTESIIRRLLETLTQKGQELANQRIFPILPVRMRWSGSTLLIPPLVREEIRSAIDPNGRARSVLVFDDAAITGRTLHDLQAGAQHHGCKTGVKVGNR